MDRIKIWLNPGSLREGLSDLTGTVCDPVPAVYLEKGLASMQKLGFIPEAQNDMIFLCYL